MIEALKTLVRTCKVWNEEQKTQVLAWLECAKDFGNDNDKLVQQNAKLEAQITDMKNYCCEVSKYLHDYSGSGVELNSPECRKRDILLIKELKLCEKWGDLR